MSETLPGIPAQTQEFESGVKVRLEPIDPEINVYLWLPDWKEWRFCGNYDPNDGVFFLKRWPRHLHQILKAWGVSAYTIEMLEPLGLKKIVVMVEGTREVFSIDLAKAKDCAVYKYWKQGGFDRQMFIALTYWDKR
jgi:hypothetical protein